MKFIIEKLLTEINIDVFERHVFIDRVVGCIASAYVWFAGNDLSASIILKAVG